MTLLVIKTQTPLLPQECLKEGWEQHNMKSQNLSRSTLTHSPFENFASAQQWQMKSQNLSATITYLPFEGFINSLSTLFQLWKI